MAIATPTRPTREITVVERPRPQTTETRTPRQRLGEALLRLAKSEREFTRGTWYRTFEDVGCPLTEVGIAEGLISREEVRAVVIEAALYHSSPYIGDIIRRRLEAHFGVEMTVLSTFHVRFDKGYFLEDLANDLVQYG